MRISTTVTNIERLVRCITTDTKIGRTEMIAELDFTFSVLQVIEQFCEALYVVLMRATLLTPEDVSSGGAKALVYRVELLVSSGYYQEKDIISNRIRSIREHSHDFKTKTMARLPNACDWHDFLSLIDERDNPLIREFEETVYGLISALQKLETSPEKLAKVHLIATNIANELRSTMARSRCITSWILGIPGPAAFQIAA